MRLMRKFVVLLAFLLLTIPASFAQIDKGSIEAIALDQSKAPLPGVSVTVSRPETGFQATAVTDSSGTARFLMLTPGSYRVQFTLEGFAPVSEQSLALRVGQQAKLSVSMQLQTSETITVSAESSVVDVMKTDSSTNIVP